MNISLAWLNQLLEPGNLSPADAETLLTSAGFPIEKSEAVACASGFADTLLDVEVTSNRGDALCHETLAREIAAVSRGTQRFKGLRAVHGAAKGNGASGITLRNDAPDACARFTLRVIRGVKVGPSPTWLVNALEAIGQRSINNVVDATNYLQAEIGNPSHVFDMAKVARGTDGAPGIIVRAANKGEKLTLLDNKSVTLEPGEIIVADAGGPISLAGVMGGASTGVGESTTDVLVEVATWKPPLVRKASRRLDIKTDAAYRFQRTVDPRTLARANDRLTDLIVHLAGGRVEGAMLQAGPASDAPTMIELRPERARKVIGLNLSDAEITGALTAQGFVCAARPGAIACTVPATRCDVRLEVDLIEEVARTVGYDRIEIPPTMSVRVSGPQTTELAQREIARILTGCGFFETVTFSFTSAKEAEPFLPAGLSLMSVSDERRGGEGVLRPSVLIGLLNCRRTNQDRRATDGQVGPAGLRLFEVAAVYAQQPATTGTAASVENINLALLADAPAIEGAGATERKQAALRIVRGAIESIVFAMHGANAALRFEAGKPPMSALDEHAGARITLSGKPLGVMGLFSAATIARHDLRTPAAGAELNLAMLTANYPPQATVRELPTMAAAQRAVTIDVDESVTWERVESTARALGMEHLEALAFEKTYRGKPVAQGKKAVTMNLRFRNPARTLRDEEINPTIERLIAKFTGELGATVRT